MKKTFFNLLFLFLLLSVVDVSGQEKIIKGTVTDTDNVPLPGATVFIKGTTKGVSTDLSGEFSINTNKGDTLVFTYIGCETKEVVINNQQKLKIQLKEIASQLAETVVVGYGSVRKKDLTGSVSVLSQKNFNPGPVQGVENLIQGRAPGVQVSTVSAEPGGEMAIRIRGNNSINSNNGPLYVIDGFPVESLDNNLNPQDIQSISILKDASAAAIYGTRGANGVVIITTKRGREGKTTISYSGNYSWNWAQIGDYDFTKGLDYAKMTNELDEILYHRQPSYSPEALTRIDELGLNTDWLQEAFQTGKILENQLSASGGSKNTKIYFSLGSYNWDGVVKNTSFDRYTIRLNADQSFLDNRIKLSINNSFATTETDFLGFKGNSLQDNILREIFRANPLVPTDDKWGEISDEDRVLIFGNAKATNPLQTLYIADNHSTNYFYLSNAFLEFIILKDFHFKTRGGIRITNSKIRRFLPSSSTLVAASLEPGAATLSNGLYKYYTFENMLTYNKTFNKHTINALLGATHEWSDNEYFSAGAKDFTTDALGYYSLQSGATPLTPVSYVYSSELISYLARINYSYDNRYLVTLTYRRDGSSKFGAGNKWGNFPAAALAWKIHNENFFNSNVISTLKLRASYGILGNDRFRVGLAQSVFSASAPVTTDAYTLSMGTIPARVGNSNLRWEETKKLDIGFEIGLFSNDLLMQIDLYKNITSNLLLNKEMPPSMGINSILTNAGEVENRGAEISINYNHRFSSKFSWNSSLTFAYNENKINKLLLPAGSDYMPGPEARIDGSVAGSFTILKEGLPINSIYGYRFLRVLKEGETYAPQPDAKPGDPLFKDLNGDGKIDVNDKDVLGNGYPKYTLGFSNSFRYSNFTLAFFFSGMFDVDKLNGNNIIGYQYNTLEIAKKRWTPNHPDGTMPLELWHGDTWVNDLFVEDASFLRLKNVSLSYNFNKGLIKRIGLSNIELSLTGQNLFTWDNYSGFDPEVNSKRDNGTNLNTASGLDAYSYPYQRSVIIGLKIGL